MGESELRKLNKGQIKARTSNRCQELFFYLKDRQTGVLVIPLLVFADYRPLPVFVVVFVLHRSRVVEAAVFHVIRQ